MSNCFSLIKCNIVAFLLMNPYCIINILLSDVFKMHYCKFVLDFSEIFAKIKNKKQKQKLNMCVMSILK